MMNSHDRQVMNDAVLKNLWLSHNNSIPARPSPYIGGLGMALIGSIATSGGTAIGGSRLGG